MVIHDEFNLSLLLNDKFECNSNSIKSLTNSNLALGSMRKDLNILLRQRCFAQFKLIEFKYLQNKQLDKSIEKLFELNQVEFKLDILNLTPAELLLVQFNENSTLQEVEESYTQFLCLSTIAKEEEIKKKKLLTIDIELGNLLADMNVLSFKLEKGTGGGTSEEGDLSMGILTKGLTVNQDEDEEIWRIDCADITGVLYLAGTAIEEKGSTRQDCSLRVKGTKYKRFGKSISTPVTVTIYLGPLGTDDPPFKILRQTVRGWSKLIGFTIGAENAPPPPPLRSMSPTSMSNNNNNNNNYSNNNNNHNRDRRYSNSSERSEPPRDSKKRSRNESGFLGDEGGGGEDEDSKDHLRDINNRNRSNNGGGDRNNNKQRRHSSNASNSLSNSRRSPDYGNGHPRSGGGGGGGGNDRDNRGRSRSRSRDRGDNNNNNNYNTNNRRDDRNRADSYDDRYDNNNNNGNGNGLTAEQERRNSDLERELQTIPRPLREHSSTIWNYLSNKPIDIAWNPGFYTRQAAFLTAIDIKADLKLPIFTPEDFAILSYKPDPDRLPDLPLPEPGNSSTSSHRVSNQNRVAAEKIYRDKGFLALESTKWLMSSSCHIPDLSTYVQLVAKIVHCRDIFKTAWTHLVDILERRNYDESTRDPIENILDIVKKLANFEASRVEIFSDVGGRLTRGSKLGANQLGQGPHHRYTQALSQAIAFEDKAMRAYDVIKAESI